MQIVMIGDMLMHDKVLKSAKLETGGFNFDHLFTNVKGFIEEADLAMVNQETIIGGSVFGYTGYPSFNTPNELVEAEINAGFDVLLFATNHAYDKGKKGVLNCIEFLDTTYPDLGYVGVNHSEEDRDNIYTYEANGIKVAILNYTYGTNGMPFPADMGKVSRGKGTMFNSNPLKSYFFIGIICMIMVNLNIHGFKMFLYPYQNIQH